MKHSTSVTRSRRLRAANDNSANDNNPTFIVLSAGLFRSAANRTCEWNYQEILKADSPLSELNEAATRVASQVVDTMIHIFPHTPAHKINLSVEWQSGSSVFKRCRQLNAPAIFDVNIMKRMAVDIDRILKRELMAVRSEWKSFPPGVA